MFFAASTTQSASARIASARASCLACRFHCVCRCLGRLASAILFGLYVPASARRDEPAFRI